jgi:hypothetical protein
MALQPLIDSSSGGLFLEDVATAAQLAWNLVTSGQVDPSQFAGIVNQALQQAEQGLPEGASVELDIHGWTNPITGTDYSSDVAAYVQRQWQAGQIVDFATGEALQPWTLAAGSPADYPDQIAWGGGDTVTLRWVKGQSFVVTLLIFVAAALVLYAIVSAVFQSLGVHLMSPWQALWGPPAAQQAPKTGLAAWWASLPWYVKGAAVFGTSLGLVGGLWFLAEVRIAEAGAPKSQIVVER